MTPTDAPSSTVSPSAAPPARGSKLKTVALAGLVALNVGLVVSLVSRSAGGPGGLDAVLDAFDAPAHAMQQAPRGDYLMIPAQLQGQQQAIIYVLEMNSGGLMAMGFDENNRRLDFLPPLRLGDVAGR